MMSGQARRRHLPLHRPARRPGRRWSPLKTVAAPARLEARDRRRLPRPGENDPAADPRLDRRRRRRRARRPASPSRSTCSRSSAATSTTATRSPRPARSSSTAASARSAGSSRRRSARAQAGVDAFLVPAGECAGRPQVRARAADHPCEEFSTGVARPGNLARAVARNAGISPRRKARKLRVFSPGKP